MKKGDMGNMETFEKIIKCKDIEELRSIAMALLELLEETKSE